MDTEYVREVSPSHKIAVNFRFLVPCLDILHPGGSFRSSFPVLPMVWALVGFIGLRVDGSMGSHQLSMISKYHKGGLINSIVGVYIYMYM